MSEVMLHAVLQMPTRLWRDDPIDVAQRHARYVEASALIRTLTAERDQLLNDLADTLDVKAGKGPTALSMVIAERDAAREECRAVAMELRKNAKEPHYECEDCWYSCPSSGGCCDDRQEGCNCGASTRNDQRTALAARLEAVAK